MTGSQKNLIAKILVSVLLILKSCHSTSLFGILMNMTFAICKKMLQCTLHTRYPVIHNIECTVTGLVSLHIYTIIQWYMIGDNMHCNVYLKHGFLVLQAERVMYSTAK